MKIIKVISLLGLLVMTGVILYGFVLGDFSREGSILVNMPWGIVSLLDLYVGFILFSAWIIYRERSFGRSLIWVCLMMVLGFWTGCIYTFFAAHKSQNDWNKFFHGRRA